MSSMSLSLAVVCLLAFAITISAHPYDTEINARGAIGVKYDSCHPIYQWLGMCTKNSMPTEKSNNASKPWDIKALTKENKSELIKLLRQLIREEITKKPKKMVFYDTDEDSDENTY